MRIEEVQALIGAEALCAEEILGGVVIEHAYAADLMSDVLAFAQPGSLLVTGLTNVQIVRTAQMLDIPAVVFVRGKHPQEETVRLAAQVGIPLLATMCSMYETCGRLFRAGLLPCRIPQRGGEEQ